METAETIVKTWMERVWNQQDPGAIDELLAEDALIYGLSEEPLAGPAGFRDFYSQMSAACSGMHVTVEDQLVDGDRVAARWSATMKHNASGKPVPMSGMLFMTCRKGKIVEGWNNADFVPLLIESGTVSGDVIDQAMKPA